LPYPTAAAVKQLVADIRSADIRSADKAGGEFTITLKPGRTFDLKSVNN
jgi:hypothetical protein